ncbi:MAG: competence/damage-inducible protein A [Dehalococcoidia bacterium]|nr:competence/damage-inducible protein A [Dehalococcoidia bacterium]
MKAEIISIGTELLMGEIVDTNAAFVASQLPSLGIDLHYVHQVGDNMERLLETFQRGLSRSDVLLCSGGLGPTEDDLTRETIAKLMGEKMAVVPELERELRSFFVNRGIEMPSNNLKQAMLIPSAQTLPNPMGTAPGWWAERNGKIVVAMPGPPREIRHMWETQVKPRLRQRAGGAVLVSRVLKITGISEGAVDVMCGEHLRGTNPTIGVYAKPDGIHVRLAAKATDDASARLLIAPVETYLRGQFCDHLWGTDEESLAAGVGRLLTERHLTLAAMESCTGGLFSNTVTDVAGASQYFKGGLVTYTTEAKARYGVDPQVLERHGAVSEQTAAAMARAAREQLGASVGVGITGVAGPSEQEGRPVGTVHIAVDHPKAQRAYTGKYSGSRLDVKQRVTTAALFHLRRLLVEMGE